MHEFNAPAERWLPIPGVPGYEVSDLGRVRSVDRVRTYPGGYAKFLRGRLRKPSVDRLGRHRLPLPTPEGGTKTWQVHALVLTAFVGPAPAGLVACHNNGNPSDNRLANLRWDTLAANTQDSVLHGTHANAGKTHCAQGHEYSDANTIQRPNGGRDCRECRRKAVRNSMRRRRAAEKE